MGREGEVNQSCRSQSTAVLSRGSMMCDVAQPCQDVGEQRSALISNRFNRLQLCDQIGLPSADFLGAGHSREMWPTPPGKGFKKDIRSLIRPRHTSTTHP